MSLDLVSCCLGINLYGLHIKNRGQLPFDEAALRADGGKFVRTKDGRVVEYQTYGSTDAKAKVIVNLHGSGSTCKAEALQFGPICDELGLRGISVTWGAHGYNDVNLGRHLKDWPTTDLAVVLEKENVDKFMVTGWSSGTCHALAAAWAMPDRVTVVGLNGLALNPAVCEEEKLPLPLGSSLPRSDDLKKWSMGWYFCVMPTLIPLVEPLASKSEGPNLTDEEEKWVLEGVRRASIRGGIGPYVYATLTDHTYEWDFDPREIKCRNFVVWTAADDNLANPAYARWFEKYFKAKGANVKSDYAKIGKGHYTYCVGKHAQAEHSIAKAMLGMLEQNIPVKINASQEQLSVGPSPTSSTPLLG